MAGCRGADHTEYILPSHPASRAKPPAHEEDHHEEPRNPHPEDLRCEKRSADGDRKRSEQLGGNCHRSPSAPVRQFGVIEEEMILSSS